MPTLSKLSQDARKKYPITRLEKYIAEVEKGYPTTRQPTIIPKIQDKIVEWKTDGHYGFSLGQEGVQHAHDDSLDCIDDRIWIFEKNFRIAPVSIPEHVLTFSCAFGTNWKVGNSCQEFVPVDMELKEGCFFTYRMLSKHDQATFYNYDGVEYLVGICYYVQLPGSRYTTDHIDNRIMANVIYCSEEYPPRNRFETELWHDYRIYGRYCNTAGKRVCVSWPENDDPFHVLLDLYTGKEECEDCEECREEAMAYKLAELKKEAETLRDHYIAEVEKGYPTTREPTIIPKIQDKIVEWKTDGLYKDYHRVGFSLGQEGVQHAHNDSLDGIQKMMRYFAMISKTGASIAPISIPKHALTFSFAFGDNWKVGNSCQEFVPVDMKLKEGGFFTYRMLSKHDQATFYNYDGVEYLIGICYYVQLPGSRYTTDHIDHRFMANAIVCSEEYPPKNCFKTELWHDYRSYGRYCKTAGKRVCVRWPETEKPVHVGYNLYTGDIEHEDCEECCEEAKTYKIAEVQEEGEEANVITIVKKEDAKTLFEKYIAEIEKGYRTTRQPTIIPKIQDKIVEWKIAGQGTHLVGISLGQEDVQHAHDDSLAYIRDNVRRIEEKCYGNAPVPHSIPINALTVSFPFSDDWKVGNSCQEFFPVNMELKEGGYFTYRMITKHFQATFYNCDGVEYLAGVCYYLQLSESRLITTQIDDYKVVYASCGSENCPPRNRFKTALWLNHRAYTRYCKTAHKKVCVLWPENEQPFHMIFDHHTKKKEYEDCKECCEEAKTYKFVEVEKEATTLLKNYIAEVDKGYPTTREPTIIPKILEKIVEWKTDGLYKDYDRVGIFLGQEGVQHAHDDSLTCIQERLWFFAGINENGASILSVLIPRHVLTFSCAFGTNWKVGNSCHEFLPVDMELKEGGFFTYRMLSKHDQATFYNYDGVEYLIGICCYVQLSESRFITARIDNRMILYASSCSEEYPPRNRFEADHWQNSRTYGRYCNTAGKRVYVQWEENEQPVHMFFNFHTKKDEYEDCEECREEAKTYKFVEVEKEAPTPVEDALVTPVVKKLNKTNMPPRNKLVQDARKKYPVTRLENYIAEVYKGYPTTHKPTIIPKIHDKIVEWKTDGRFGSVDWFGISLGQEGVQHAHDDSLTCIHERIQGFAKVNNIAPVSIPKHALTFSFAFGTNWKVGNSCQEFLPVDMELKEGGFFTYRMLSKHDQATFYNYDGVEYLVGICYYVQLHDSRFITAFIDNRIMATETGCSEEYPPRNRFETELWLDHRIYGRYCKTAGQRVYVHWPENKHPFHVLYCLSTGDNVCEDCEECREEAKTYKFAEVQEEAPSSSPVENAIAIPNVEKVDELKVEDVMEEDPVLSSDDDFEFVDYSTD